MNMLEYHEHFVEKSVGIHIILLNSSKEKLFVNSKPLHSLLAIIKRKLNELFQSASKPTRNVAEINMSKIF